MNENEVSEKDLAIRKMVAENNQHVLNSGITVTAKDLLLIIPHCLQNSECAHRITFFTENCTRCGKCVIKDLLDIRDRIGFRLALAPGGRFARRAVDEYRPKLIIAAACERDLSSFIRDIEEAPIWGILIGRPNGPCMDTRLDFSEIERAIARFVI